MWWLGAFGSVLLVCVEYVCMQFGGHLPGRVNRSIPDEDPIMEMKF